MKRKREIKMPEYTISFKDGEATKGEQIESMLQILGALTEGYMEYLQNGEGLSEEEQELAQNFFPKNKNFGKE